jgi:hypothetical protein
LRQKRELLLRTGSIGVEDVDRDERRSRDNPEVDIDREDPRDRRTHGGHAYLVGVIEGGALARCMPIIRTARPGLTPGSQRVADEIEIDRNLVGSTSYGLTKAKV